MTLKLWQKCSIVIWLGFMVSYNLTMIATWICGVIIYDGSCLVRLTDLNEQYIEGLLWAGSLLASPWAVLTILKLMKEGSKNNDE